MNRTQTILDELMERHPALRVCRQDILLAYELMIDCFRSGGRMYVGGNGGSAADAEHLVGELQKGFCLNRPLDEAERKRLVSFDSVDGQYLADRLQGGLPAVSLVSQIALGSAVANDQGGDLALAQSLSALGRRDDVFLGISTSGNARNVALASLVAHCRDMHVIGLTGRDGGWLAKQAEVCIAVPEDETYRVQELHLPVYHTLCMMVEDFFFQNP